MLRVIAVAVLMLIALFDYALVVACSRWEDKEEYFWEMQRKEHDE